MAISNSYVTNYQRVYPTYIPSIFPWNPTLVVVNIPLRFAASPHVQGTINYLLQSSSPIQSKAGPALQKGGIPSHVHTKHPSETMV